MPRNCAFLTLEDRNGFCIYDHLLVEPLAKRGWSVEEIPWDRQQVAWQRFDAVVIRSTWDYQNAPERFMTTLEQIEGVTRLFNPTDICRWNLNKGYLRDMQAKGVPIVPTHWLDGLNPRRIEALFETTGAARLVAKPLIGANADDTYVLGAKDPSSWEGATGAFATREVMVQPFIDAILDEGEYSLFYFGGRFSHAIVKRPAQGDFRVQEEHGGIIRSTDPDADLVRTGNRTIAAIEKTLLYARVDLVRLESGKPALIELELIEPSLYFDMCPDAADRFADRFDRMVDSCR